jgi:hypothetical protein
MTMKENLLRRLSESGLFLAAAILFPLLVLVGYFKSYYFRVFFDVKPVATTFVQWSKRRMWTRRRSLSRRRTTAPP